MKTNTYGIEIIKHFEGFSSTPYLCPAGYKTIGYGHLIKANENFTSITLTEAEELLIKDLRKAENSVINLINTTLHENQFSALVSFVYNLGGGALQGSTLRMKINRGETNVENEFLKWVYANGKKLRGLLNRRIAEAELFAKID
ncbi:MAG: lysozyme [Alphaproteobacteria bacterium]|jgi:lysozyme